MAPRRGHEPAQRPARFAEQRQRSGRVRGRRAAGRRRGPGPPDRRDPRGITRAVGDIASHASSIDLGLEATGETYAKALDVLLDTPGIDGLLVIHAPAAGIDPGDVAQAVAGAADRRKPRSAQRPILAAWLGEGGIERARRPFDAAAIPAFTAPEPAVRAFLYRVSTSAPVPAAPGSILAPGRHRPAPDRQRRPSSSRRWPRAGAALTEVEAMALAGRLWHPQRSDPARHRSGRRGQRRARAGLPRGARRSSAQAAAEKLGRRGGAGHHRQGVAAAPRPADAGPGRGRRTRGADRGPAGAAHGALAAPVELYLGMEIDPTFGPILLLGHGALRAIGTDLDLPVAAAGFDRWPTPWSTIRPSAVTWPSCPMPARCWRARWRSWSSCRIWW